jgi:hypothetical protein
MYKTIVFIDFENLQRINASLIDSETKLIVMVGLDQDNKAFDFARNLFNDVSSIELIKVNGRGHNALDIFISFYLGLYFVNIKEAEIIICSNDSDYDQLIKHLNGNGISIKRVCYQEIINVIKKTDNKEIRKKAEPQKIKDSQKDDQKNKDNVKTIVDYLRNQTESQKKKRPKKLTTLENDLVTHFSKKISKDIVKNAIELMKKNNNIIVVNNKINYNNI